MMQRKAWAAVLGIATIGLTGCPGAVTVLGDDPVLGLPTSQRPARGDQLPGTLPPSGGGGTTGEPSTGGSGPLPDGGGSFGESGTNPAQVALDSEIPLHVESLFPKASQTSVSITNASRGMLAIAGHMDLSASVPTPPSVSITWPSASSLQSLLPGLSAPAPEGFADEAAFKRKLRQRLGEKSLQSTRGALAPRALAGTTNPSVWILDKDDKAVNRPLKVYPVETLTHGGRTTRFALAVDTADEAIFSGDTGTTLRTRIVTALKSNIIPSLQADYGGIPSQSEASGKSVKFQDDVTYFIFSSTLRPGLLGYFNPGDFFEGPTSNQIKALYLSAGSAQSARSNQRQLHDLLGTMAHELQHLQFAWNRVKAVGRYHYLLEAQGGADIWIDEGLAMLATANAGYRLDAASGTPPYHLGPSYNLAGHVKAFLSQPGAYSLVAFHQNAKLAGESGSGNPAPAYGMAYLFAQYMVDQVGTGSIQSILSSTKNGFDSNGAGKHDPLGIVSDGLSRRNVKLNTLFSNFAAAVALDGTEALASSADTVKNRYDIKQINLRQSPFWDVPFTGPATVNRVSDPPRPYGIRILDPGMIANPSTLRFSGNTNVSTRLILHR